MTRGQAIAEIQRGLGFRSDLLTQILFLLDEAQKGLEMQSNSLPWYLKREDQTLSLTTATPEVTIPANFLSEVTTKEGNIRFKPIANGRTFFLQKMDLQPAEVHFYGSWLSERDTSAVSLLNVPGQPRAYVQRANTFRFYPAADQTYTLTWDYYGSDTLPSQLGSDSATNLWLTNHPWLLVGDVGLRLAGDTGNADALAIFNGILTSSKKEFLAELVTREIAGRQIRMGSRL